MCVCGGGGGLHGEPLTDSFHLLIRGKEDKPVQCFPVGQSLSFFIAFNACNFQFVIRSNIPTMLALDEETIRSQRKDRLGGRDIPRGS